MCAIRFFREKAGLSQAALAQKVGVSQQAVGKWERGESSPQWGMAPKLAELFGCTIDELYGLDPPREEANRPGA